MDSDRGTESRGAGKGPMTNQQRPGAPRTKRRWSSYEVGAVLVFAFMIAVGAFFLAGGGSNQPSAAPATTPLVSSAPSPLVGLEATVYMCGGTAYLPGAHPSATYGSEVQGARASLEALVGRLSTILPDTGWNVWSGSATGFVFVAQSDKTAAPFTFVQLANAGSGWVTTAYGDCEPSEPSAAGNLDVIPASWQAVSPASTSDPNLRLQFQLDFCRQSLVGSTVWYSTGDVTVTLWARNLRAPGVRPACAAASLAVGQYSLSLAEGLGQRQLRAGPATNPVPAMWGTPAPAVSLGPTSS